MMKWRFTSVTVASAQPTATRTETPVGSQTVLSNAARSPRSGPSPPPAAASMKSSSSYSPGANAAAVVMVA